MTVTNDVVLTKQIPQESQAHQAQVWAVGGGKGGVGKSVLSTAVAMTLASLGHRCILVDADLGGANLHTCLGMAVPSRTISDLFRDPSLHLQDTLLSTPYKRLKLVSGARAMLTIANLKHTQKTKLIRQLFSLEADHILIDLGAGSSFNVLDFFIAANHGMVVVTPTPSSMENAYHFLRAVYFRKLRSVIGTLSVEKEIDSVLSDRVKNGIRSPKDLMVDLLRRNPTVGEQVQRAMSLFRPSLIVNQIQRCEHRNLDKQIALACREFLGIEMILAGGVRTDERVMMSLHARQPVLTMFPNSHFAEDTRRIAQRLCSLAENPNA